MIFFINFRKKPKSPSKVVLPPPSQPKKSSLSKTNNQKPSISLTPEPNKNPPSPERNNNNDKYQIRPGTYKKSDSTPCDVLTDEDPTREDIMSMVEKDVAFSSLENRRLLMAFIRKICQAS